MKKLLELPRLFTANQGTEEDQVPSQAAYWIVPT